MRTVLARAPAAILCGASAPFAAVAALGLRLAHGRLPLVARECLGLRGAPLRLHAVVAHPAGGGLARAAAAGLNLWLGLAAVARGRLAWVGPRARELDEAPPPQARAAILGVKPGLVSLYAVRARTGVAHDTEDVTDLEYVARRGLRRDLGILLRGALGPGGAGLRERVPAVTLLFGLRHLNLAMDEVLDLIAIALRRGRQTRVAFVNPDCVNRAQRDPVYRAVLARFDWVLTDGIGMVIAGRLLGQRVRQNVNGTDLFPRLCELLGRSGHSLYLLGGRPGVAEGVVDWIGRHHPRVRVAGVHHGYFTAAEAPAVIRAIRASGAAVLLVGLGVPRQERWIAAHSRACGAVVTMGVGGLFDFYSGRIPRAPQWLREIGGEWAYRLVQEPGRLWRRYLLGNAEFLLRVARLRVAPPKGAPHGTH